MKSSLPNPTKAEKRRFEIIAQQIGCIACIQNGHDGTPADVHHLISKETGNRISHAATIGLCKAHHLGPYSIHRRKVWFRDTYGSDESLLVETNHLVADFESRTVGAVA